MGKDEIILGLDVSTSCIGYCLFQNTDDEYGKILKMGHISPKLSNKVKGIESLFVKKKIFNDEFISHYKNFGITRVIIEEPIAGYSKNVNTVAVLLRFNGMISDCVYNELGVVPEYISSHDARMYAFPDLMSIRRYNKKGEKYNLSKIRTSIKKNDLTLFGNFPFDIDKKQVVWNKTMEIYPNIEWIYDKNGELKKENFDANDALVTCLGVINKEKFNDENFNIICVDENEKEIKYTVEIGNFTYTKRIEL